jgi:type I restriction enzyme, S subunit
MSFEIPADWAEVPLADMCARVSVGYVGETSSHYTAGTGIALIRSQNVRPNRLDLSDVKQVTAQFHESSKKSQLVAGDLLIVRVGQNRGDCAVLPSGLGEVNCANIVFARPLRNYSDFFGAYFNTPNGHDALLSVSSGSAQLVLNTNAVAKIKVPVPPPDEAYAIGTLSRHFDDRITLLRETNATLEAIAQALFKSWFVDFDPVRAKLEGRAPQGMDEATAALFPDGFEESALGLVPRGWRVGTLQDLLLLQRGFDLPSDQRMPGDYPIIAASGPSGTHNVSMAKAPGVVTGRSGVLGRVFLELDDYWPLNTTLWVKEFRGATPCYAYELLCLLDLKSFNAGSAVPTLNRNHVHGLRYLVPPYACVTAYESIAIQLHERVRLNDEQAQTLATLRDTLLPRLISGQLRLPELEAAETRNS